MIEIVGKHRLSDISINIVTAFSFVKEKDIQPYVRCSIGVARGGQGARPPN